MCSPSTGSAESADDGSGVFRITRGGEGLVSVTTVQGESFLLKVTDDGLMQQDLGGQGALRDVVPLRSDRVFALEGGTLRVASQRTRVTWSGVERRSAPMKPLSRLRAPGA